MLVEIIYGDAKNENPRDFVQAWVNVDGESLGRERPAVEWLLELPDIEIIAGLAKSDDAPAVITVLPDNIAVLFRLTFPDFHVMLR